MKRLILGQEVSAVPRLLLCALVLSAGFLRALPCSALQVDTPPPPAVRSEESPVVNTQLDYQAGRLRLSAMRRGDGSDAFRLSGLQMSAAHMIGETETSAAIEYETGAGLKVLGEYRSLSRVGNGGKTASSLKQGLEWKQGGTRVSLSLAASKETDDRGPRGSALTSREFKATHDFAPGSRLRSLAFRHDFAAREAGGGASTTYFGLATNPAGDASLNLDYTLHNAGQGPQRTQKISFNSGSLLGVFALHGLHEAGANGGGNNQHWNLGFTAPLGAGASLSGLRDAVEGAGRSNKTQVKLASGFGRGKNQVDFAAELLQQVRADPQGESLDNLTKMLISAVGNPRLQFKGSYLQTVKGLTDSAEDIQQVDLLVSSQFSPQTKLLASLRKPGAQGEETRDIGVQQTRPGYTLAFGYQQALSAPGERAASPYVQGHLNLGPALPNWAAQLASLGILSPQISPELSKWIEDRQPYKLFPNDCKWGYIAPPTWFSTRSGLDLFWRAKTAGRDGQGSQVLAYSGMIGKKLFVRVGYLRNPEVSLGNKQIVQAVDRRLLEVTSRLSDKAAFLLRYAKDFNMETPGGSEGRMVGLRLSFSEQESLEAVCAQTTPLGAKAAASNSYGLLYSRVLAQDHLLAFRLVLSDPSASADTSRGYRVDLAYQKAM